MEKPKKKTLGEWWSERTKNQKYLIIGGVVLLGVIGGLTNDTPSACDCADIGSKVQIVGYQNLTSEQKKLYDACEKKYTTPAAAFEACVESQMPKK